MFGTRHSRKHDTRRSIAVQVLEEREESISVTGHRQPLNAQDVDSVQFKYHTYNSDCCLKNERSDVEWYQLFFTILQCFRDVYGPIASRMYSLTWRTSTAGTLLGDPGVVRNVRRNPMRHPIRDPPDVMISERTWLFLAALHHQRSCGCAPRSQPGAKLRFVD